MNDGTERDLVVGEVARGTHYCLFLRLIERDVHLLLFFSWWWVVVVIDLTADGAGAIIHPRVA